MSKPRPRKFTLQYSGDYWFENEQTYVGDPDKEYHVIEYSAYESLERQLEIALNAIEFYSVGWVRKHARLDEFGVPRDVWKNNPVMQDAGTKAKNALDKIAKLKAQGDAE